MYSHFDKSDFEAKAVISLKLIKLTKEYELALTDGEIEQRYWITIRD